MNACLIVEQESPVVGVFRGTDQGLVREVFAGLEASIALSEMEGGLPLAELVEGVEFAPEFDQFRVGDFAPSPAP